MELVFHLVLSLLSLTLPIHAYSYDTGFELFMVYVLTCMIKCAGSQRVTVIVII